jgi:hypothetical protein
MAGAILNTVYGRLADGTLVAHPNIVIGALTTQCQPCAKALGRIFRQILAMPELLQGSLSIPPLLVNLERCIPCLQGADRAAVGCWLCCVDRIAGCEEGRIRLLLQAAEEAGFPADLRDWAKMRCSGTATEMQVPDEVMEELPAVQAQAVLNEIRSNGQRFWDRRFVDGEAARRGRVEMLRELLEIDAAAFDAIAQTRVCGCPGRRRGNGKGTIQVGMREKVFRIVFGIRKETDLMFVRMKNGELWGTCAMAELGEEVLLTWWGGDGERLSLAVLLDSIAPDEGDWFNGRAVFRIAKSAIARLERGKIRLEIRGLELKSY